MKGSADQQTVRGVNSYDEFTRLREVVVGAAEDYNSHHLDRSFQLFHFENLGSILESRQFSGSYLSLPIDIRRELEEDVAGLVNAIEMCGVIVYRPARLSYHGEIRTPLWSSRPIPALNVRDQAVILGRTIVETAPQQRSRYFENDLLKPIFYRYLTRGSNWISMPRPALAKGSLDESYFDGRTESSTLRDEVDVGAIDRLGLEIAFDGAQCIRLGTDVLVNVANQNHQLGLNWLRANFGQQFRFHCIDRMSENHIDSHVVPLRPGLMIIRSPKYRSLLPEGMRNWDYILPPPMRVDRFPNYGDRGFNLASRYVDINVLSIDESTVIANSLYPELIKELERLKFEVIPVRHRHRRLFNGGFHCFTLDCVRDGGPEDYLH